MRTNEKNLQKSVRGQNERNGEMKKQKNDISKGQVKNAENIGSGKGKVQIGETMGSQRDVVYLG